MKDDLIQLAREKIFISNIIGKSVEVKYSTKSFYYLWMCELQKWLRDTYNLHLQVSVSIQHEWYFEIYNLNDKRCAQIYLEDFEHVTFKTNEEALEIALFETLKLIK